VQDVLDAALRTFAEDGYAGLTIDAVATKAGVNKTTVYRRWTTKAELLGAALASLRDHDPPMPDTGSLREDLFFILSHLAVQIVTPARQALMHALLLNKGEPELAEVVRRFRTERPALPPVVFTRAIERGQLPPDTNTQLLSETLLGALHSRAYWKRESLNPAIVRALIELIVSGAEAGGACVEPAQAQGS
jgi:AcrR family transcriptional regulator